MSSDFEQTILHRLAQVDEAIQRLEKIDEATQLLLAKTVVKKDFYTIKEAAKILGRRPFTVRQWANCGRIHATKIPGGRGRSQEWRISADEIRRIQNFGLLPRNSNLSTSPQSPVTSKEVRHD